MTMSPGSVRSNGFDNPDVKLTNDNEDLQLEDDMFGDINEDNYKNSTVEQIKNKLIENENNIKKLLREYFQIRQKESLSSMLQLNIFGHKKPVMKKANSKKQSDQKEENDKKADIDMIIEEYLNLNQIT